MAGAKLTPLEHLRTIIREDFTKGGNPTLGSLKEEVAKLSKKHNDKRDQKGLTPFSTAKSSPFKKKWAYHPRNRLERRGRPKSGGEEHSA